jgi:NitT/TauT family transport system substrate-binding protein
VPQENAQTLDLFKQGQIDGAWVPEPWATRLVEEGGGKILVDERKLWPNGRYVTTHLIVRTEFLDDNPDAVKKLLEGHVDANNLIRDDRQRAEQLVAQGIDKTTGRPIAAELVTASFENLVFTNDPIATSLRKSAKDAEAVGLLKAVDLKGIYNLKLLNQVLKQQGEPTVKACHPCRRKRALASIRPSACAARARCTATPVTPCPRSTGSRSTSAGASSCACSARRAAARAPC